MLDFSNTEIAFSQKSDKALKKSAFLFGVMNKKWLTSIGTSLVVPLMNLKIPFVKTIVKKTIFEQFCGGENLMDTQDAINYLQKNGSLTILDYGAESKSSDEELEAVLSETIKAIELAAANNSVPVVSTKITGLVENEILEKLDAGQELDDKEIKDYNVLKERLDKLFGRAAELGVGVFVDAEESWMQEAMDDLVLEYMLKYNKDKAIVYNTYQLYRHHKLTQMKSDHEKMKSAGVFFGAKIVRGAYMEKERNRAQEMGYTSPIHKTKADTDKDFNEGVRYCVEHYKTIASCCASHNVDSNLLQARLIDELGIEKNHPHLNFCQLYGMSDNISFNLAHAGYNVAKYVPYGPVEEVIPYLIRRAKENTSVTGEASRELSFIRSELKRRKLA